MAIDAHVSEDPSHSLHSQGLRIESVDVLRGFVMLVMALDHSRDFFSIAQMYFSPTDIAATTPAYFITRLITNICAPVFIFLTGIGMSLSSKQTASSRTRFLVTRGMWLLVLQVTIMNMIWLFNGDLTEFIRLNVLWAIGWAMISLAAVTYLPRWVMWIFAFGMIFGHNLLDSIKPEYFGSLNWVWVFLHTGGVLSPWKSMTLHVLYPVIPWCGVITLGYLMGGWIKTTSHVKQSFVFIGLGIFALAVLFRIDNTYGNPTPWMAWPETWRTVASYVNALKYPPSLLYIGLYLSPFIVLLGIFINKRFGAIGRVIATFGKVPFFYYVLHVFLLHLMAVIYFKLRFGQCDWLFTDPTPTGLFSWSETAVPAGIYQPQWDLVQTYVAWIIALILLYPLCRWFSKLKTRRNDWWMSYL